MKIGSVCLHCFVRNKVFFYTRDFFMWIRKALNIYIWKIESAVSHIYRDLLHNSEPDRYQHTIPEDWIAGLQKRICGAVLQPSRLCICLSDGNYYILGISVGSTVGIRAGSDKLIRYSSDDSIENNRCKLIICDPNEL